jgi:hypothetical protein
MPSHAAHPQPIAWNDILWIAAALMAPIGALVWWGIARFRQARTAVKAAIGVAGLQIVTMRRRLIWAGPFGLVHNAQVAYRLVVRDASGVDTVIWAAWGRTWVLDRDRVELRWESGELLDAAGGGRA